MSAGFFGLGMASEPPAGTRVAVVGAPMAETYPGRAPHCAEAPAALRGASTRLRPFIGHHDFDMDGPFGSWTRYAVDLGDVPVAADDGYRNRERIEQRIAEIARSGAAPLLLGGDDAVTIPFVAGFKGLGPVSILHLDAHLDFRDEVHGSRWGYSSPMRRAIELDSVRRILHVGLRGVGSARAEDVAATLGLGNHIVPARQLGSPSVESLIRRFFTDEDVVVAFDCDVIDPREMPAVRAPVASGPSLALLEDLLIGLAENARIRGISVTEFVPSLDPSGVAAAGLVLLLSRLLDVVAARSLL